MILELYMQEDLLHTLSIWTLVFQLYNLTRFLIAKKILDVIQAGSGICEVVKYNNKYFFYKIWGKVADESPDGKRLPLPMDPRNTRSVASALPAH